MSISLDRPTPDGAPRRDTARKRRDAATLRDQQRGAGVTLPNGEEVAYDLSFALNYHKGLPHDNAGSVHAPSYRAFVHAVSAHDAPALELLPMGLNRSDPGANPAAPSPTNPERFTQGAPAAAGYRKLTSPLTGHVFETEGGDAGTFAIAAAPVLASDELAAEMAELYGMALLRDVPFTDIEAGTGPAAATVSAVVAALGSMPWLDGSHAPATEAERRRFLSRTPVTAGEHLFRGSTPGSRQGPWLSQYLLVGNTNNGFRFVRPNGNDASNNTPNPTFRGTLANFGREDGFVLFGTQVIDQRSIVAVEAVDYMTDWPSWLDAQNGVDFNNLDRFRDRRRYLTTPRDIATYVHYDALYQAYLVACLLMLADSAFGKDRGLPETESRTRSAFASFGGPHILSVVTEVATRALKAVWRQKWLHHRRARPEVVAALLTLHANDPGKIPSAPLNAALGALRAKIPADLLDRVNAHNKAQNARADRVVRPRDEALPADFPNIDPNADLNFLLPMAFPEGSPTHPAYGAGHATVAGACVTVLKAFFEMFEADGTTPRAWPLPQTFVSSFDNGNANEGGELVPAPALAQPLTIQGELDKLAMNIANARNMAGVHYYTDYFESVRLGERIAVSIIEEQMSMYSEPVSLCFTSFDGDRIRVAANGGEAVVQVYGADGPVSAQAWYARYET
jgi:hypothetical protein